MKRQKLRKALEAHRDAVTTSVEQQVSALIPASPAIHLQLDEVVASLRAQQDALTATAARIDAIEEVLHATTATLAAGMTQLVAGHEQTGELVQAIDRLVKSLEERDDVILARQVGLDRLDQTITTMVEITHAHSQQLRDLREDFRFVQAVIGIIGGLVMIALAARRTIFSRA